MLPCASFNNVSLVFSLDSPLGIKSLQLPITSRRAAILVEAFGAEGATPFFPKDERQGILHNCTQFHQPKSKIAQIYQIYSNIIMCIPQNGRAAESSGFVNCFVMPWTKRRILWEVTWRTKLLVFTWKIGRSQIEESETKVKIVSRMSAHESPDQTDFFKLGGR